MARASVRPVFTCQPVATQSHKRAAGDPLRTALREAAYIRRSRFVKGQVVLHDFSSRAEDLFMLTSIVPPEAGDWAHRPYLRWQLADEAAEAEDRRAAVRAWHLCGDLKEGLSTGQWMDQVHGLVRSHLPQDIVAEIAGHLPTAKPAHAHVLVAPRRLGPKGYQAIDYGLYDCLNVDLRAAWEEWLRE